jgi:hypothetical protein
VRTDHEIREDPDSQSAAAAIRGTRGTRQHSIIKAFDCVALRPLIAAALPLIEAAPIRLIAQT